MTKYGKNYIDFMRDQDTPQRISRGVDFVRETLDKLIMDPSTPYEIRRELGMARMELN